jgi:hypothetical protein
MRPGVHEFVTIVGIVGEIISEKAAVARANHPWLL